jgi:hypothetical protein
VEFSHGGTLRILYELIPLAKHLKASHAHLITFLFRLAEPHSLF